MRIIEGTTKEQQERFEEYRTIEEAFNDYATHLSPIAAKMRTLSQFEAIKNYSGSKRIQEADKRYLYWDAQCLIEMEAGKVHKPDA